MRPGEELRYLILAAQREDNRSLAHALRRFNLTPAWAEVLMILAERSPLSVKQLGNLLVCESDHPSRLAERMVHAGLLERRVMAQDKRAVFLSMSPRAKSVLKEIKAIEDDMYHMLEEALSKIEMATTVEALRTLVGDSPTGRALERRKHHQENHTLPLSNEHRV